MADVAGISASFGQKWKNGKFNFSSIFERR
jgi:hypothetical protein